MSQRTLRLYRSLLRHARALPTHNHRAFVQQKVRREFREPVPPGTDLEFLLKLGDTHLETLALQVDHLTEVINTPGYHHTEYDLPTAPGVKR